MQRQILGLGSPPGPVQHLLCVASQPAVTTPTTAAADSSSTQELAAADAATGAGTAAGAGAAGVVCSWLPPADAGQPGMHKYLLQRVDHSSAAATWQTVAELQDSLSVRYRDVPPQPGLYQYRLAVSVLASVALACCGCLSAGKCKHIMTCHGDSVVTVSGGGDCCHSSCLLRVVVGWGVQTFDGMHFDTIVMSGKGGDCCHNIQAVETHRSMLGGVYHVCCTESLSACMCPPLHCCLCC
jgi:hypothetical protein